MKPIVILDNGHGKETAGKRSPVWGDGSQLFEWEFNRDIVRRIAAKLDDLAIGYEILTPETNDVSLAERCRRANEIYRNYNEKAFWCPSTPTPEAVRVGRFTRRPEKRKRMQSPRYLPRKRNGYSSRTVGACASIMPTATRIRKRRCISSNTRVARQFLRKTFSWIPKKIAVS